MKKATFQKPDATYPHGSLREHQWLVKTSSYQGESENWFATEKEALKKYDEWYAYEGQLQAHTDKPKFVEKKPIPCSENKWKDGQELEEGKDYEIKGGGAAFHKLIAIPIVAQETEDEDMVIQDLIFDVETYQFRKELYPKVIAQLKSKFTIQRKQ